MQTYFNKDYKNNWQAQTFIDMGIINEKAYTLTIRTMKYNGLLKTSIQASFDAGDGFTKFVLFKDFNKSITHEGSRCTEKVIETLHNTVLKDIEKYKQEMIEFYQTKAIAA